jgi:phage baseplate assembly protein V
LENLALIDPYEFSELRRQMANLVSMCEVIEVEKSKVRVRGTGGVESGFLPVLSSKTGESYVFSALEIGEKVVVLASGDLNSGFVIGSFFKKTSDPEGAFIRHFKDGTHISYDETTHELTIKANGKVSISCDSAELKAKDIKINSESKIDINGPSGITLNQGKGAIVTTECNCLITGTPHLSKVLKVKA